MHAISSYRVNKETNQQTRPIHFAAKLRTAATLLLQHQNILYDYKVELTGVGNRSQINTDDNIVL